MAGDLSGVGGGCLPGRCKQLVWNGTFGDAGGRSSKARWKYGARLSSSKSRAVPELRLLQRELPVRPLRKMFWEVLAASIRYVCECSLLVPFYHMRCGTGHRRTTCDLFQQQRSRASASVGAPRHARFEDWPRHAANGGREGAGQRLTPLADWVRHHIRDKELASSELPTNVQTKKKPASKP